VPSGNLLVAQGGGPTAVINCSLVGVIEEAKRAGVTKINKIIGALNGVDGIIDEEHTISDNLPSINAGAFTLSVDDGGSEICEIREVSDTPMDSKELLVVGDRIEDDYDLLKNGKGYDDICV